MFRGPDQAGIRGKEQLAALSHELERQAHIYAGLGVHKDTIMRLLAPRPDRLPKELSIPVVTLGTSVSLDNQARLAGITPYFDLSHAYHEAGGITYAQPYLIWMSDGKENTKKSVAWVREHMKRNARGATLADGIALAIVHPDIKKVLRDHSIDLPGSSVGSVNAPYLGDWGGDLRLYHSFVGNAHRRWGSALSGS